MSSPLEAIIRAAATATLDPDAVPAAAHLLSDEFVSEHVERYRHLHAHPELSSSETETAAYITARLGELGLAPFAVGGTGVVAVVENGDGPVVAFRADTDGLPILEQTGLDYASSATGVLPSGEAVPVMHGCGHDTHIVAGLGVAQLLVERRDEWSGRVVLIFQPAEETAAGARALLDDGLWLKAPKPDVVLAQHVGPAPELVTFLNPGNMASLADSWRITVFGKGAHGSQPEQSIDPIVQAAAMVLRLQTIVSRELAPQTPAVVTVGTFHAGLKENIIPETAEFTVNVRTPNEEVREQVLSAIRRIVAAEATASGAREPRIEEISRFPRLYNDPGLTPGVAAALEAEFGAGTVISMPMGMGSEDAGLLGDAIGVPVVFWGFGSMPVSEFAGGMPAANHSPFFKPNARSAVITGTRAAYAGILHFVGSER
ncbi:amidohydrolase [Agromyces seonyuensis]|uniref:Amidohydrolase n=1 Tax=Agromyces seonyuensis TaxID=2662446 RepID=A0A6I4P239_9MICO|nr:amidohydrolase [Agromyces seonyuensis]MWB97317.1 amidohydrolase [Agromyces seonyuensis]